MKNDTVIKRTNNKGQENSYHIEVKFEVGNCYFGSGSGYYLTVTPCFVKFSGGIVKDETYQKKEFLFAIQKETKKAQSVAESVADNAVDALIEEIDYEKELIDRGYSSYDFSLGGGDNPFSNLINEFNNRNNGINTEGKKGKRVSEGDYEAYVPETTLDNIYGMSEVKIEVVELIKGFTEKELYKKFNVTPPQGVLLSGNPGNGKSALAKAVAGEAKINFIQAPSASFANKYVGTGSASVKELFKFARANTPAVLFIDEIDSVGAKRDSEHKENASTLNQLLIEISNKEKNEELLIIGATNRTDMLDEALTRTGRLDRKIIVPTPDTETRLGILNLYSKDKPLSSCVDLEQIAHKTSGMSGSDMESIITEACMLAIREGVELITQEHLQKAVNKMVVGLERQSTVMSEEEKRIVSLHEAGHLVCSSIVGGRVPTQISLIPTGDALGYVQYYEEGDKFIHTQAQLNALIVSALGGKASEFVFFNHLSSGCSGDLKSATSIANQMVTKYGMSRLGSVYIDGKKTFMQEKVHNEIKFIIDSCYNIALDIIKNHKELVESIANELIVKEKLNEEEISELLTRLNKDGISNN